MNDGLVEFYRTCLHSCGKSKKQTHKFCTPLALYYICKGTSITCLDMTDGIMVEVFSHQIIITSVSTFMETKKKIFVASSMLNPFREELPRVVDRVNEQSRTFHYELVMFENTAFPARNEDTQQSLNELAATCDIFLFLIECGTPVGCYTMGEYRCALEASRATSSHTPFILPYILYSGEKKSVKIPYKEIVDGVEVEGDSIEERITTDFGGKKYVRFTSDDNTAEWDVDKNTFLATLQRDLLTTVKDSYYYYRQEELSYAHHIRNSEQNLRISTSQYFVREELDTKMADIANISSLLIIEGNSYSGKTRAVYELMKNNPQWRDADFYIYNAGYNTHSLDVINSLSMYRNKEQRHAVFFFDDFSKVLDKGDIQSDARFWQLMRSITPDKLPKWEKVTIIITMPGELTRQERHKYYEKIFGRDIYSRCYGNTLHEVIVRFDIYNRTSFNKMVAEMVRCGIISADKVRPGNYTIGSLFIDYEEIRNDLSSYQSAHSDYYEVLQIIKMQQMYCKSVRKGLYIDIKNLWCHIKDKQDDEPLRKALEALCSQRWIVLDYDGGNIARINIDNYVIEAITLMPDYLDILIGYAASGKDCDVKIPERMGYVLCDRMCLLPDEIKYLIAKFGGKQVSNVRNLYKICSSYQSSLPAKIREDQYANVFCQNAISSLSYNESVNILNEILAEINNPKRGESIRNVLTDLYIKTTFRMLSEKRHQVSRYQSSYETKPLTMAQERELLSRIFTTTDCRVENMQAPFSPDDLKDVFNLRRITRFLTKSPIEIVDMAEEAASHSATFYVQLKEDDEWGDEEEVDQEGIDNIFIPQLGSLLIEAMLKTSTFDELMMVIELLRSTTEQYIQEAVSLPYFTLSFYKNIKRLSQRYTYEDRLELFLYLIHLPDDHSILSVVNGKIDSNIHRFHRIRALNDMLSLLDESSVIKAYEKMVTSGNIDDYTLSMYMNNEFLMFEHLLDAVMKYGRGNYLTNNKLLDKAKTLSDAYMCLHSVMHVRNDDPARLKDEYALGAYLAINDVSCNEAIDILKRWRKLYADKLLKDRTLGTLISKFSKDIKITTVEMAFLFGVPNENDSLCSADELYDRWGLYPKEINILRQNPHCWNQFFQQLNRRNELALMRHAFDKLMSNGIEDLVESSRKGKRVCFSTTRDLIFDDSHKTYILSEYIKNIFKTYDETRRFIDTLRDGDTPLRLTAYIFKSYLRKIVYETIGRHRRSVDDTLRRKGIDRVNAVLIDAYKYFVNEYTSSEVIEQMSNLYSYRIQLVGDDVYNYDQVMPYAYEDRLLEKTFAEYLDFIYNNETAYAEGNFVFMALCTMNSRVDDYIYDKIKAIAKKNHRGIDMEKKSSNENMRLSDVVLNRLINIDNDVITIDRDIVYNYSPIKMLIFIAETKHISYQMMDDYRSSINAPITSTYLNHAFKVISTDRSIYDKYALMKTLLVAHCTGNTFLSMSIQMFVNMLKVSKTIQQLDEVITLFPDEFRNTPEFIAVWSRRYFFVNRLNNADLALQEICECIVSHPHLINIAIVNSYLSALYFITTQRNQPCVNPLYEQLLADCWLHLNATGNIDMNVLLQMPPDAPSWEIHANQLSYIYFAHICPINIVECVVHRFNGNFLYEGKKSCLSDCVKNYIQHQLYRLSDLHLVVQLLTDNSGKCIYYKELDGIRYEARNRNNWFGRKCYELCDKLNIL